MAHQINVQNGKASMMYVGEEPWHGLGTKLDKPAKAAEAIKAAGLNWDVIKQPIFAIGGHVIHPVVDKYAVVRSDQWAKPDCSVLGIVSGDYIPLQNREAFEFFDPIAGKGAAIYHTAGALGKGERVWILAKLPSDIRVKGDDIVNKFLLLSNSHDGKSSVQIKFTPIRVVCQNTLTMALTDGPTLRVAHTRNLDERLKNAERSLNLINLNFAEIEKAFQQMTTVDVNTERLGEYLRSVFKDPTDPENYKARARVERDRLLAEHLFHEGAGNRQEGVTGTLWAAYNGVTELVDHRQTQQSNDKRLESVWFGDGYSTKARAFKIAKARLKAWLN